MSASADDNLSPNAERILLLEYIRERQQFPDFNEEGDDITIQVRAVARVTGLTKEEVISAYAELEDAGMVYRV